MTQLIFKELRQLLPFAFLWFCLMALFYGSELASVRIDEQSYLAWCQEYCDIGANTGIVIFVVLFYMIAAYSLFPREFDDATVDFLRSLPIGRTQIFTAKVIAAWLLLCLLIIIDRVTQIGLLAFNTQSITGKTYLYNDLMFVVRDCLFAYVIVCHGVFLSWFRTTGLVIYCAYLIGLIMLEQILGASGPYNIFSFYSNEYDGHRLLLDWPVIGWHLVAATILLAVGYILWTRTESKPKAPGKSWLSRVLPVLLSTCGFLFVIGWMLLMMQEASEDSENADINVESTEHYVFSYKNENDAAMQALLPHVEADYQQLVELLGTDKRPVIQTDMTSDSEHALGLASWKKIQMILQDVASVDPLYRRVLSHETAHVFQAVESERALGKSANSTGFFVEGMAQYTSFEIVPDEKSRTSNWLVSAVSWKRHNIRFAEMVDRTQFESLYDPEMLYGIGDIWVQALVDACGKSAMGDFLRAIGREDAPPIFGGEVYWRQHLQYIGCELESVNSQWRTIMKSLADNRTEGAFPRYNNISVTRAESADRIKITADLELEEGEPLPLSYFIRIQSEAKLATTVSPVLPGKLIRQGDKASVEFSVLPRLIEGKRFRFQLGYTPLPGSRNYYEKWRSGSLPR